jgi:nitrogen regulatory protein PII
MEKKKVIKITCSVYRAFSPLITEGLRQLGVRSNQIQSGRSIVLVEKPGLLGLTSQSMLEEDPSDVFTVYVDPKCEETVLQTLIDKAQLHIPGRGTIFSEEMELLVKDDHYTNKITSSFSGTPVPTQKELVGVCCIVQRGQGDDIVRACLDMGFCVPNVTFGEGMGVRDKLGLLRIAIPGEKDIVHIVVSKYDIQEVMNVLITIGKLDQPGKGFIYHYPIKQGLVNTKIFRGKMKHAASIEQIIAAIDNLKGNSEWRKMESGSAGGAGRRQYLTNVTSFSLFCNEGYVMDLVQQAMAAGAPGATVGKLKYTLLQKEESKITPPRESGNLIVGEAQIEKFWGVLSDAGFNEDKISGFVEISPVPQACTYLGAKR